jgi:hypothetical protein
MRIHFAGFTCEQMLTHTTHALESKDAQLAELSAKHQAARTELQSTQVYTLHFIQYTLQGYTDTSHTLQFVITQLSVCHRSTYMRMRAY